MAGTTSEVDDWLEGQTLEQGTRVCEMLGLVLDRGPLANAKEMAPGDWRKVGEIGFAIARKGPEAVRHAFEVIRSRASSTAGQAGPKAMYGRLYEWLAFTDPLVEHGPIRSLLREHILDTTAIEAGQILLGEKVLERRTRSIHSLSIATGLHRKRLRKVLAQVGLIPSGASDVACNHLVFPAVASEEICRELASTVPLNGLPSYLDCSRTQAKSLYDAGVLVPFLVPDPGSQIRGTDFSRRQLDDFLANISKLPVREDGEDIVDLSLAARTTALRTGKLVGMILSGDLPACRVEGKPGLSIVRVPTESLMGFQHPGRYRRRLRDDAPDF